MPVCSVGTVLSRSFSIFFKQPFVFLGQLSMIIVVLLLLNFVLEFETILAKKIRLSRICQTWGFALKFCLFSCLRIKGLNCGAAHLFAMTT